MTQVKPPRNERMVNFKVDRDLYERFLEALREDDPDHGAFSRYIRRHIREYVAEREQEQAA